MKQQFEQVKKHLSNNRVTYIACGVTAVSVSTLFLTLNNASPGLINSQKIQQIAWRPKNTQVIVNLTEKSTASKPVHLVGSNLYFDSLSDAARKTGYHLSDISKVVNGHRKDINGDIFELLTAA